MMRGSCLCGQVGYEVRGPARGMYYCHCGMCRKATGSSFATNLRVSEADFRIVAGQALVRAHESSPGEHRHFCSACGSPLFSRAASRPGMLSVRCGTLDGDPGERPAAHIYAKYKAPWFEILDGVRQFPEAPG